MSDAQKCQNCGRACNDGYACTTCAADARKHLWSIGYLLGHVDTKRAKLGSRVAIGGGLSRSRETPLPYDPRITTALVPVKAALLGSAQIINERRGVEADTTNWQRLAFHVGTHANLLRTLTEGPSEFDTYRDLAARLDKVFDRPPDTLYLGQCGHTPEDENGKPCEAYVYVERTRSLPPFATCPACEATIDVMERRDYFTDQVKLYQATMRELVELAPLFLEDGVPRSMLWEWTRHGHLLARGHRLEMNALGAWREIPTYRIGDLEGARVSWEQAKEDRRSKRKNRPRVKVAS